jgi:adenosine deaminase
MLRAGVRCALGTDDPGLIPCDLVTERQAAQAMGLTPEELAQMQAFSQEDAWCLQP